MRSRLCIGLLVFPLLLCSILDIDSWPFSNFPMYSYPLRTGVFTQRGVFVVRGDGSSQEIRAARLLWPLNYSRLLAQARNSKQIEQRLQDYARRWPLQPGDRLELRKMKRRFSREGHHLRSELLSTEVELEVPAP